jgi:hypothetical protein
MNRDASNKPNIGCVEPVGGISDSASTMNQEHWWMRQKDALSTLRTQSGPVTSMLLYASLLVVMSLPAIIWHQQTGDISLYFTDAIPAGQLPYVLSKLAGMYALLFIALQIIMSLAARLKLMQLGCLHMSHPILGTLVVLLGVAHALLFFTAVSLREGDPVWGLLFPDFRDFYHTHLSMGLFGLWILIAVMISGVARHINRSHFAKMLHRGYWVSIVLVYIHALAIGTESQSRAGLALYSILGGVVLMMLVMWLIRCNRSVVAAS